MSVQKVLVPPLSCRPAPPPGRPGAIVAVRHWIGPARGAVPLARHGPRAPPRRARPLRRGADDRVALVALAQRYASTQPEFAKDLFAAAGCRSPDLTGSRLAGERRQRVARAERLAILVVEALICSGLRALYKFG